MAEDLKACPFCGRIPKTSHRPESEASGGGHVAFVVCYCGGYASTAHQMGHAETVQAAIAEVVEKWNSRAKLPSQGGEAVAVVGYLDAHDCLWNETTHPDRMIPLMTVGQHQRIMASTHPADQVAEPDAELVELLRSKFPRIDPCQPVPLDEKAHCCEYTIYVERERLHRLIDAKLASLEVEP